MRIMIHLQWFGKRIVKHRGEKFQGEMEMKSRSNPSKSIT